MDILIVEDAEDDAILLEHVVHTAGLPANFVRVDAWEPFVAAMTTHNWDAVLLDFHLPTFNALDALKWSLDHGYDLPMIIVSGAVGEEMAAALMRAGAKDFVRKETMARLAPAIEREAHDHGVRKARRRAEEQERFARAEVEAARELERLKTLFVNSITHELRTPMTAIIGFQELLEEGELTEAQREYVQGTLNSARRLQRLVEDLLDHARIEAGTFTLRPAEADLAELVQETTESMRREATAADVRLEVEVGPGPLRGEMDPQRIEQVLANFLTNAIKFTPPGGVVHVRARAREGGLWCEVEDSGPGIAPEDASRLFQPFAQLELGARKGGTGPGLAIAKSLVEAHGGRVELRSKPGLGSTFSFCLPLHIRPAGKARPA
jgi:signal transduction histidine kinase